MLYKYIDMIYRIIYAYQYIDIYPDIDINILSFSPGILRQIFSKDWLKESND